MTVRVYIEGSEPCTTYAEVNELEELNKNNKPIHFKGHLAKHDWWIDKTVFVDNGIPLSQDRDRPCKRCGCKMTKDGHDACLGTLKGVNYACCGHGIIDRAYVEFSSGEVIRGEEAIMYFNKVRNQDEKA